MELSVPWEKSSEKGFPVFCNNHPKMLNFAAESTEKEKITQTFTFFWVTTLDSDSTMHSEIKWWAA